MSKSNAEQKSTSSAQTTITGDLDDFDPTQHVIGFNDKTMKRAKWEEYDFSVTESGNVEVVNSSYGGEEREDHVYHVVTDSRGIPKWCLHKLHESAKDDWSPCPAMAYHAAPHNEDETEEHIQRGDYSVCKHCLAYARNEAVVRAVRQVKRNGGDN
jgi:hypothetical protein